jgi:hypothetical protein
MIRKNTKELVQKANDIFDQQEAVFSFDYARYGLMQVLIDIVVQDCLDTVNKTDLRAFNVTTYDKEYIEGLRERFMNSIKEKYGNRT